MWREGHPSARRVGMQTGAATMENSMETLKKINNLPYAPLWFYLLCH